MTARRVKPTRRAGLPLWRQIEAQLRSEIAAGAYQVNVPIPPEPDLVKRFGVNRLTVRQALGSLQNDGYIRIEPGRGTFVQQDVLPYNLGERVSFSENLLAAKRQPSRRLIESREVKADAEIASRLKLAKNELVILIAVTGEADGHPILYGLNHYPAKRFRGLDAAFRKSGSLTRALREFEVNDYQREVTELIARLPTALEARYLAQGKTQPVVETRSVDIDADRKPISFGITCFAANRIRFVLSKK